MSQPPTPFAAGKLAVAAGTEIDWALDQRLIGPSSAPDQPSKPPACD
jgi:hypothetical protein